MKTQTKSRALLLVCVLVLAMALTAVFAFSASAADATELNDYALVLTDGVDIKVTGTVAEADLEKEIQVVTTCHGVTPYDVTVEDGAFAVQIPVSATRMANSTRVDLVVDGEIVDTQYVSVNAYAAAILGDEDADAGVKQLVSDIIRYGQAVLTYADAEDEAAALADGLELVEPIEPNFDPIVIAEAGEKNGTVAINKIAMELDGRINLLLTTDVAVDGYTVVADGYDVEVDGTSIKVVGIPVSAIFDGITVGIYDGEDLVSNEICYSVSSYIFALADTNDDEKTVNVLASLYLYGLTAHNLTSHEEVVTTQVGTCQATGLKTTACEGCGYVDTETLPVDANVHSKLTSAVVNGNIKYTCEGCSQVWASEKMVIADGTNTTNFSEADSNQYFSTTNSKKPDMTDGYYAFVAANSSAVQAQTYLSCPGATSNAQAHRLGFVSFSLKASEVAFKDWALQLVNNTTYDWSIKGQHVLDGVEGNGALVTTANGTPIALKEEGFTRIDISFVPTADDKLVLTYYVDGVAVAVESSDYTLKDNTPNQMYISGHTSYDTKENAVQPSLFFDDWMFAYADSSEVLFASHEHTAGSTLVDNKDGTHGYKCANSGCDEVLNSVSHVFDFGNTTCAAGTEVVGECVCGATTIKVLEHTLCAQSIANNVVTYKCATCGVAYTLDGLTYGEAYTSGTGSIVPSFTSTLENQDGSLYVVNNGQSNSDMAFYTLSKYTKGESILFGFDLKLPASAANRTADFLVLFKMNGSWDFQPANPLSVDKNGNVKMLGKTVDVQLSSEKFTSFLFNMEVTTSGENVTYTLTAWVNGEYVGTFTDGPKASTGYTASLIDPATVMQISVRTGANNAMYFDNVFLANGLTIDGTAIEDYLTAVK